MKKNIILYIIATIILIYILIFKIILTKIPHSEIINILFWCILSVITYLKYKYPKSKSYIKKSTDRLIVISLLSLFIVVNLIGLVIGFAKNPLNTSLTGIIRNIYSEVIVIFLQEYIRYIFCKNSKDDLKPIIFITIIFVILNIIMQINAYNLRTSEGIFCFICACVILSLAEQSLYTYISYQVAFSSTLLFRIPFSLYTYVVPIVPNLGEYLFSTINLVYYYVIYHSISTNMQKYDKHKERISNVARTVFATPIVLFLIVLIILISIGSNSMKDEYGRGDAVIYRKTAANQQGALEKGLILVFKKGDTVITHRIIEINKDDNGKIYYQTKGDNNKAADNFIVYPDEVMGYVVYKIPYIGYPTILLTEAFDKEE